MYIYAKSVYQCMEIIYIYIIHTLYDNLCQKPHILRISLSTFYRMGIHEANQIGRLFLRQHWAWVSLTKRSCIWFWKKRQAGHENKGPIFLEGKENLIQMYGWVCGISLIMIHCLVGNAMTPENRRKEVGWFCPFFQMIQVIFPGEHVHRFLGGGKFFHPKVCGTLDSLNSLKTDFLYIISWCFSWHSV